jgi:hypothetical protein
MESGGGVEDTLALVMGIFSASQASNIFRRFTVFVAAELEKVAGFYHLVDPPLWHTRRVVGVEAVGCVDVESVGNFLFGTRSGTIEMGTAGDYFLGREDERLIKVLLLLN